MRSRRDFLRQSFSLLGSYALLKVLGTRRLLAEPMASELADWVRRVNTVSADLKTHQLSPRQWQEQIEALLEQVSVEELLGFIDFDALERNLRYPDLGVDTENVEFPGFGPTPKGLHFFPKLFGMKQGRAIIPHGHKNMVSAHLVIGGSLHLRQYDRVGEDDDAWWVQPTIDQTVRPGHASSISDEHNNVHWLVATGGRAYTLDVIITGISENEPGYEIQNLDPEDAQATSEGLLRMPKLNVETALQRYGKDHHS